MLPTQLLFFRTEAVPDALVVPALCKLGKGRSTLGPVSASNQKPWATRLNGLLAHPCGSEESLDARSTNAQASKTTKPGASDFGVAHEGASLGQPPQPSSTCAGSHREGQRWPAIFWAGYTGRGSVGNSVRIAEKHYSQWIESRQATLEDAIKRTWAVGGKA
jgi:hypothetical protein